MGARTGHEILTRLKERPPALWVEGEQVGDPTTHPHTANVAQSLAALYDLQLRPDLVDIDDLSSSPRPASASDMSFIVPRSQDDLARRSAMNKVWADATLGFMGRTPDYLNVNVMAAGMAADYFSQNDPRFGPNMRALLRARPRSRPGPHPRPHQPAGRPIEVGDSEHADPYIALGVVRETADGIVVRGARMLATLPISDEILIFPSTVLKRGDDMNRYAIVVRRSRTTSPGSATSAANRSTSGAATPTTRSDHGSTRWTRWCTSTTCSCRGSACS